MMIFAICFMLIRKVDHSLGPEDLVFDVLGNLGIFVDFIDRDESENVLSCDDLLS